MATLTVQVAPQGVGIAPNYQAVSAADKFLATPGAEYVLHYQNGATPQASSSAPNTIVDQTSVAPAGSTPAAGWADVATSAGTGLAATTELVCEVGTSMRFIDAQGFINIKHPGTLTTLKVAIIQV